MRLAIVGSVSLAGNAEAESLIEQALDRWMPTVVVSGGAKGIDSMAAAAARKRGIEVREYLPGVQRWDGPDGFRARNLLIAGDCDRLVRIVSATSKTHGSGWTRDQAAKRGVPCHNYIIQP